jgi:hypothetical protein
VGLTAQRPAQGDDGPWGKFMAGAQRAQECSSLEEHLLSRKMGKLYLNYNVKIYIKYAIRAVPANPLQRPRARASRARCCESGQKETRDDTMPQLALPLSMRHHMSCNNSLIAPLPWNIKLMLTSQGIHSSTNSLTS